MGEGCFDCSIALSDALDDVGGRRKRQNFRFAVCHFTHLLSELGCVHIVGAEHWLDGSLLTKSACIQ